MIIFIRYKSLPRHKGFTHTNSATPKGKLTKGIWLYDPSEWSNRFFPLFFSELVILVDSWVYVENEMTV